MSARRVERALKELVRETRAAAPPELDWTLLEARLPSGPIPPHPVERPSRWGAWLVPAAAIALVAGNFVWGRLADSPQVGADAPEHSALPAESTQGDRLVEGTSIATLTEARTIEHPQRATWTLAPHSQATLVTRGSVVVVRLERGSLTARIVPSTRPESFAVETADVRVAVHGTVFRVALDGEAVAVSVDEGSVLVGPRATPGIGKLLAGPSAERFTLLGAPVAEQPRERANRPAQRAGHAAPEIPPPAASGSGAPAEPQPADIASATDRVEELASACFSERTSASDGVRVTAHTVLSFVTAADGSVSSVRFEPPLAPNVQACIDHGKTKLRAAPSARGFQGTRVVDLER